MREPEWLLEATVSAMHLRQLAEHGGVAGIRDGNLLAPALARPRQLFAYADADVSLCDLAAAYGFGIACNHPFVDGNKRTALVATLTFLALNGVSVSAPEASIYQAFMGLADGTLDESALGAWLRANTRRAR